MGESARLQRQAAVFRKDRRARRTVADCANEFRPALFHYFQRRTRACEDSEDLVQEVFVRLLKYDTLSEVRFLRGLVFQIANSVLVDWSRRSKARRIVAHDRLTDFHPDEEAIGCERWMLGKEAFSCVTECIRELPEKTQSILIRRRLEGQKNCEIAREMGVSVSTVEKHIHQAMAHLRSRIEEPV